MLTDQLVFLLPPLFHFLTKLTICQSEDNVPAHSDNVPHTISPVVTRFPLVFQFKFKNAISDNRGTFHQGNTHHKRVDSTFSFIE